MKNIHAYRTFLAALMLLAVVAGPGVAAETDASKSRGTVVDDRWYVLKMEGRHAGWAHEWQRRTDEHLLTFTDMRMTIRRGPVTLQIEMETEFVETHDGEPVRAVSRQKLGTMQTVKRMEFQNGQIELISRQAGQTHRRTLPAPQRQWQTPGRSQRFVQERIEQGVREFSHWQLDPSSGTQAFEVTWRYVGDESVQVVGKVVPATHWKITTSNTPGAVVHQYVDEDGRVLRTDIAAMPGLKMQMILADKQVATADVDPPELLRATLIRPQKKIENPRQTRLGIYELSFDLPEQGDFEPEIVRGGAQRVVWGNDRTARVVVDLSQPLNPKDDLPEAVHREASSMANSDDPKVRALVDAALKDAGDDPAQKAEALRRFVATHIEEKDLSVGLATASEVARTEQGDCTEHAVLLAAMLRAAGIPSRVVSGLVYVDRFIGEEGGLFGYHMWAQAWIRDPRTGAHWVDLDATLGPDSPFDATHIALSRSPLGDEQMANDLVQMAPLIGRLSIEIVEVSSQADPR